jgi:hypothetical protein
MAPEPPVAEPPEPPVAGSAGPIDRPVDDVGPDEEVDLAGLVASVDEVDEVDEVGTTSEDEGGRA